MFCRLNLSKTDYEVCTDYKLLSDPPGEELLEIYMKYCRYKQFPSHWPLFIEQFTHPQHEVIGYYDNDMLVAFSLIYVYNSKNAECLQFAWDYINPKLRLGIKSLRTECAIFKDKGFDYLYLGEADEYKRRIKGFEILGPLE